MFIFNFAVKEHVDEAISNENCDVIITDGYGTERGTIATYVSREMAEKIAADFNKARAEIKDKYAIVER